MPGLVAEYQIKILNTAGELVSIIDTWNSLEYEVIHNDVGSHTLTMQDGDARVQFFQLDYYVQVWRKPPGGDWYIDYDGFHRTPQHTVSESNLQLFTSYGRHINSVLARRTIMYFAGSGYTKKSGPVDDVMKDYVEENAGPTALTNPDRMRNILTAINVPAHESLGPNWQGERSFKTLLEVLQELGKWSTWRFYVDRDVDEDFGSDPNALVFRTFEKRVDSRIEFSGRPVVFSPQLGNMRTPSYTVSRTDEIQAVVALGQGEKDQRIFLEELGDQVAESPYNDIEYAEDARQEELTAGLEVAALTVLAENGPQEAIEFTVVQIPSCLYGLHYRTSDYVTATFRGVTKDYRIVSTHVSVRDGKEEITCRFQVIPPTFDIEPGGISASDTPSTNPLVDIVSNFSSRLSALEKRESLAGFSTFDFGVPIISTGSGGFGLGSGAVFAPHGQLAPPDWTLDGPSLVDLALTGFTPKAIEFSPGVVSSAEIAAYVHTTGDPLKSTISLTLAFTANQSNLSALLAYISLYQLVVQSAGNVGTDDDLDRALVLNSFQWQLSFSPGGYWALRVPAWTIANVGNIGAGQDFLVKIKIEVDGTQPQALDVPLYLLGGEVFSQ